MTFTKIAFSELLDLVTMTYDLQHDLDTINVNHHIKVGNSKSTGSRDVIMLEQG